MRGGADDVLAPVIDALRAYDARMRHLDVELRDSMPGLPPLSATRGAGWMWLRELLAQQRVPAEAFLRPGNRLGVLHPILLRRVLAVRALYACRTAVRRCIDRGQLVAMRAAVGASSLTALQRADGETLTPLPAALEAASLALQGLLLMRADGSIDAPGVWHLMTLQIVGSAHATDLTVPTSSADGLMFLERVAALVPELAW